MYIKLIIATMNVQHLIIVHQEYREESINDIVSR